LLEAPALVVVAHWAKASLSLPTLLHQSAALTQKLLPQLARYGFLPEQQQLFLKPLAPALTAAQAINVAEVAVHMQNQAQQLVSLPAALLMQTYLRRLRMDQLLIVGSITAQILPQQQHLKVY
jgi:hypothetical protein